MKAIAVKEVQTRYVLDFDVFKKEGSAGTFLVFRDTEGEDKEEVRIFLDETRTKSLRRKLNWSLSLNPKKKRIRR